MLDPKIVRENPDTVLKAVQNKNLNPQVLSAYIDVDRKWRQMQVEVDGLKNKRREIAPKEKPSTEQLIQLKQMAETIKELEAQARDWEMKSQEAALEIPNIPHASVPVGKDASANAQVREHGTKPIFSFQCLPHADIGQRLGILDFDLGAKIAGAGFVVMRGKGAVLERALINFMLDLHTSEHGYLEMIPPFMASSQSMTVTGQLPKFKEDVYHCDSDDLYLVPTAEVPLTNLHYGDILDGAVLPLRYTAYTPCFRREAGAYGKESKGLIRQHQFNKVELMAFCRPEDSYNELENLTRHAGTVLQKLGLHYRVVVLSTGDMSFASAKTYDLEVWFPSENRFREISSCSNFESFQARRGLIRFRRGAGDKPEYVHTLNGSGLAVGRTVAALLENYQRADGSVDVPPVLRPYMGGVDRLSKEG